MTTTQLAQIVQDMRRAQKKFFDTRDPYYLKTSKELEKKVDRAVEDVLNPKIDLFSE